MVVDEGYLAKMFLEIVEETSPELRRRISRSEAVKQVQPIVEQHHAAMRAINLEVQDLAVDFMAQEQERTMRRISLEEITIEAVREAARGWMRLTLA
jgi:hypothetical protein